MRKFLPVFMIFSFFAVSSSYGQWDSCLTNFCGSRFDTLSGPCLNEDSTMVDTCFGSSTYGALYAKRSFSIHFRYYVIDLPQAPYDTLLEIDWRAIDTSQTTLRASFMDLENKYGTFTLIKHAPHITDSTDLSSLYYHVRFHSYVCVDSVLSDIKNNAGIRDSYFSGYPAYKTAVYSKSDTKNSELLFSSNPVKNTVVINRRDGSPIKKIEITSSVGVKVFERRYSVEQGILFDVSLLASGQYTIIADGFSGKIVVVK